MTFELDPRLAADCVVVGELPLCRLLLMNDSRYPWCILVPRVADATEIFQLSGAQQQQLMEESSLLGQRLMELFSGHKLNVAALGNVVKQLHVHQVVRFHGDQSWPGPVWGVGEALTYESSTMARRIEQIRETLADVLI